MYQIMQLHRTWSSAFTHLLDLRGDDLVNERLGRSVQRGQINLVTFGRLLERGFGFDLSDLGLLPGVHNGNDPVRKNGQLDEKPFRDAPNGRFFYRPEAGEERLFTPPLTRGTHLDVPVLGDFEDGEALAFSQFIPTSLDITSPAGDHRLKVQAPFVPSELVLFSQEGLTELRRAVSQLDLLYLRQELFALGGCGVPACQLHRTGLGLERRRKRPENSSLL